MSLDETIHNCYQDDSFTVTCAYIEQIHALHFRARGKITPENTGIANQWVLDFLNQHFSYKRPVNFIADVRGINAIGLRSRTLDSAQNLYKDRRLHWFILIKPQKGGLKFVADMLAAVATVGMRSRSFNALEDGLTFLQSAHNPFRLSHVHIKEPDSHDAT